MPAALAQTHLALLLERASRAVSERLSQSIGIDGITPEHWRVLHLLSDEQGKTMGAMAEQLGMNPPTLTKLIDRMVGQSLVQRGTDPQDSRRVLLYTTDSGLDLLAGLHIRIQHHEDSIALQLGKGNARQLERLLTQLIESPEMHLRG